MRVVLVGSTAARAHVRPWLDAAAVEIAGEATTVGEARAAGYDVDAFVVVPDRAGPDEPLPEPLTRRELDVLELMADGLPNKAIAQRLGISDQTVKFHVAVILAKLGAANRTEAVRVAVRRGLIAL